MRNLAYIGAIFAITICTACATSPFHTLQNLDDPNFYDQHATWDYEVPKTVCFEQVKITLRKMGYGIEESNNTTGKVITKKRAVRQFVVIDYAGKPLSYHTVSTDPNRMVASTAAAKKEPKIPKDAKKETYKYEAQHILTISGDTAHCQVKIDRLRIFINGEEQKSESEGFVTSQIDRIKRQMDMKLNNTSAVSKLLNK